MENENRKEDKRSVIISRIETVIIILACIFIVTTIFFIKPFKVSGDSMDITFHDGQRVFVSRMAYRKDLPEYGDVIVFKHEGKYLIKRVIGKPGDVVEVKNCKTYVNGNVIDEPYVDSWLDDQYGVDKTNVPKEEIFVMGDNRDVSMDSRDFGCVNMKDVTGKVIELSKDDSEED